jgi:hypothetical protein
MTSLLQRKAAWGPSDVTRFAELAGQEHANERAVGEARSTYNVLLEEVEAAQLGLTGLIRERYQQVRGAGGSGGEGRGAAAAHRGQGEEM